jgi:hypothetical protein
MKKLFAALALAAVVAPVGRHPDRHAVRAWHDLRLLPDHCQARAFQG